MAKDYKIIQSLCRAMTMSVGPFTIADAYSWYISIGGCVGYYEFRKQAKEEMERLLQCITEEEEGAKWGRREE